MRWREIIEAEQSWIDDKGKRQIPKGIAYDTPIPMAHFGVYAAKNYKYNDAVERAPVQEVPLDSLKTVQSTIDGHRMKPWNQATAPPIEVAIFRGENIITQGNHRAASAWVADVPTILARVINLDDPKNYFMLSPKARKIARGLAETSTAGATGAASVATVVGGLGAGFDPSRDHGVYQKVKPRKLPLIRR